MKWVCTYISVRFFPENSCCALIEQIIGSLFKFNPRGKPHQFLEKCSSPSLPDDDDESILLWYCLIEQFRIKQVQCIAKREIPWCIKTLSRIFSYNARWDAFGNSWGVATFIEVLCLFFFNYRACVVGYNQVFLLSCLI